MMLAPTGQPLAYRWPTTTSTTSCQLPLVWLLPPRATAYTYTRARAHTHAQRLDIRGNVLSYKPDSSAAAGLASVVQACPLQSLAIGMLPSSFGLRTPSLQHLSVESISLLDLPLLLSPDRWGSGV